MIYRVEERKQRRGWSNFVCSQQFDVCIISLFSFASILFIFATLPFSFPLFPFIEIPNASSFNASISNLLTPIKRCDNRSKESHWKGPFSFFPLKLPWNLKLFISLVAVRKWHESITQILSASKEQISMTWMCSRIFTKIQNMSFRFCKITFFAFSKKGQSWGSKIDKRWNVRTLGSTFT